MNRYNRLLGKPERKKSPPKQSEHKEISPYGPTQNNSIGDSPTLSYARQTIQPSIITRFNSRITFEVGTLVSINPDGTIKQACRGEPIIGTVVRSQESGNTFLIDLRVE